MDPNIRQHDETTCCVAIIGGGCAGLAASAELASRGISVTIYEASRQLGGRARGLNWKGTRLDNGQHILLGAYSETLRLLRLAGVDADNALCRLPLQLIQHGLFELRASPRLPAPLHILVGLLQAEGLSRRERLAALRFMAAIKLRGFRLARDEALDTFLAHHRQPEKLVKWLWEPLCLAALNTPLHQASAQVFLNVLRDSFSKAKSDSDMLLPRRDLSTLIAEPLAQYVKSRGGSVQTGVNVTAISSIPLCGGGLGRGADLDAPPLPYPSPTRGEGKRFVVETAQGSQAYSHVIAAVSPFRLGELVAGLPPLEEAAAMCASFDYQPIVTVYLQYPASVRLPFPMIGLSGGHAQWVLDRGALEGQDGLLAVVISAEGRHQDITQDTLAAEVTHELAQAFPDAPAPLWHKVIAEKRATFACRPNLRRPGQQTALPGFYLAGDYTAGDYPATIEGAVRSGVKCARMVLKELG